MNTVTKVTIVDPSLNSKPALSERHRKRPILNSISNMTDEEIINASVKNANKKAEQSRAARALKQGPLMFLAASSVIYGALTKGKLSDKTIAAAKYLGAVALLQKPVEVAMDNAFAPKYDENGDKVQKKHPLVEAAVGLGAVAAAAYAVTRGVKAGINVLNSNFSISMNHAKKGFNNIKKSIDSTKAGKFVDKLSKDASVFAVKHPQAASLAQNAAFIAPCAAFLTSSVALSNKVEETREKEFVSNVGNLLVMREFAKAALEVNPFEEKDSNKNLKSAEKIG